MYISLYAFDFEIQSDIKNGVDGKSAEVVLMQRLEELAETVCE